MYPRESCEPVNDLEEEDEPMQEEGADEGWRSEEAPLKGTGLLRREREPVEETEKQQPENQGYSIREDKSVLKRPK